MSENERDDAFPADAAVTVIDSMEKWPGVEMRLVRVETLAGETVYAVRDYLVGEGRYAPGAFVVPAHKVKPFAMLLIRGVRGGR